MRLMVLKSDGTVERVAVRYSPQIGGLYTCVGEVYDEKRIPQWVGAQAPFVVYEGMWCHFGYDDDDDEIFKRNIVAKIPYEARAWNLY